MSCHWVLLCLKYGKGNLLKYCSLCDSKKSSNAEKNLRILQGKNANAPAPSKFKPVVISGGQENTKEISIIENRVKPTWLPPQPFLDLGIKTKLLYERIRARSEI